MNMRLRWSICALLGGACALASQVASAAESTTSPGSDNTSLETIIVTAQKRSEALIDVPMSVTALNGSELQILQDHDFADYAAMVPGLSLNASQPGMTRLTLRGQNAGGDGSTVAVYVDESPFGSSTGLVNGGPYTGDFDTWDMQRIEVLRGPQGTLYGANSEGGILKFVTNAPELGSLSGAAEVTGVSVANGGNGGDVRVMLNLPLGDKMALRVSAFDEDVPGYIDDPVRDDRNLNDGHKSGGRASFLVAPTEDLSIRLTATSQESRYAGINTVDVNPTTLQPLYGGLTQERVLPEPSEFKYENYNATVDWNLGPVRVLSSTSYSLFDTEAANDVTPVYGPYAQLLFGATPTPGALLDDGTGLRKFTQEIRLSSPTSTALEWQAGAYFTHEIGQLNEYLDGVTLPAGTLLGLIEQPIIDSAYKETAGFADVTYHFLPQFDVQIGGRYSHNVQDATEITNFNPGFGIPGNSTVYTSNSSGNVFTYSAAPQWHVNANTMVYARVATGYRPGGPNVVPPEASTSIARQYGADKTTNVELGVKSTLLDGALYLDVAMYHVKWKNIQLLEVVDAFGINGNGGDARTQGLEWTVGYSPLRGLKFEWTGAYTQANLTSSTPGSITALNAYSGDALPYAPRWGTSVDGEYDWVLVGDLKAFAGATWSYVGSRSSDFGSAPPPNADGIGGQLVLPSYNTTAVRLGVDKGPYRFTVFGKNLTDARGITDYESVGSPFSTVTVIQPRTLGATLSVKF